PCASWHTDRNFTLSIGEASYQSIPGHPRWGWRQSRWHGKASLWATSVGRSRIRHATAVGTLRHLPVTREKTTWWDGVAAGSRTATGARNAEAASRSRASLGRFRRRLSVISKSLPGKAR